MADRLNGTVKWFDSQKGYGFVTADGKDFFIHHSYLPEGMQLDEGEPVSFEPVKDERGRDQAKNLQKGGEEAPAEEPADEPVEESTEEPAEEPAEESAEESKEEP